MKKYSLDFINKIILNNSYGNLNEDVLNYLHCVNNDIINSNFNIYPDFNKNNDNSYKKI